MGVSRTGAWHPHPRHGDMLDAFRGHLPESDWYPAREDGIASRRIPLAGGEHARVVESGPPGAEAVLFLHGWACSAYFFRHLVRPVVAAGYRVVALDLRGHGGSSRPPDPHAYAAPAMRDFVLGVLAEMGLEVVHVVAHSLGGAVALDLAAHDPARVRTLSLLAPVGLAPVRFVSVARLATPEVLAPMVPYAVPRWSIPLLLRAVYGREGRWASRDVDEYWGPTRDPDFSRALRHVLHHFRFTPRSDEELAQVTAPTLILLGGRDLLVRSRASARRARDRSWRCVTVPRAGHVLAEEVPATVLAHLLPHLAVPQPLRVGMFHG